MPSLLLPYQRRACALLAQSTTRVLVIEKSRRIGMTWGLAAYAVLKAAATKAQGGSDFLYISFNLEMTREFISACSQFARALATAAETVEEPVLDEGRALQSFGLSFASGFAIKALSSTPRSLRGRQGVVLIDEAAFVEDLPELLKAALSLTLWGGQVIIVSTHNGAANPFAKLVQACTSGAKPYAHMRVDLDDALADGLYQRICAVQGLGWSAAAQEAWRAEVIRDHGEMAGEELFCIPSQTASGWLSPSLIEARMVDGVALLRFALPGDFLQLPPEEQRLLLAPVRDALAAAQFNPDLSHALGGDFARVGDLSVFWVLALGEHARRTTALVLELKRFPFAEQEELVAGLIEALPNLVGAAFDATGSGAGFVEGVQRRCAGVRGLTAVHLSQSWYRTHMPPVKRALEESRLTLPRDEAIAGDFRAITVTSGVPSIPPHRTGGRQTQRHGDAAMAAALAYSATEQPDPGGALRFFLGT